MMLGLIDIFPAQLAAKPERREPAGLQEKAKGEKDGCGMQRRNVSRNFIPSNLVQYKCVINSQRTVFVCVFLWDSRS